MSDIMKEIDSIIEAKKNLKAKVIDALIETGREYLETNPKLNMIFFGGYTPQWNDGDTCEFTMGYVNATTLDNPDFVVDPDEAYDENSEVNSYQMSIPKDEKIQQLIDKLDSIGMIEDTFNSYGFIVCIHRNEEGQYVLTEKEYDNPY